MKKNFKISNAISGTVEAWHCGALANGHFSLDFLGSGEGINYLGPGIYFASNKKTALVYAKYVNKPFIYKCSFSADGLYDSNLGEPLHLRERIIRLNEELRKQFNKTDISPTSSFKYGKHTIGFLHEKFGRQKAFEILKSIGINGAYEILPDGTIEYCIFDVDSIKIVEKEAVGDHSDQSSELVENVIAPISKAQILNKIDIDLNAFRDYSYHFFAERTALVNKPEYEDFPLIHSLSAADILASQIINEIPDTVILDYGNNSWIIGKMEDNFKKAQLRHNYDYPYEGLYTNLNKYKSVSYFRKKRRAKRRKDIENILNSRPDRVN
jgi:hypothetical protein